MEYAIEAIKVNPWTIDAYPPPLLVHTNMKLSFLPRSQLGSTAVGISTSEGVVLAVEKRITSPLMEPSSIEKILEIDSHIGEHSVPLVSFPGSCAWVGKEKWPWNETTIICMYI